MVLEYGHTFGHALESLSHGKVSHGESVAVGMCLAAELSHRLGYIDRSLKDRHYSVLSDHVGIDLHIDSTIDSDAVMRVIARDNKRTCRGVRFVLLNGPGCVLPGDGDFLVTVPPSEVKHVIDTFPRRLATASEQSSSQV